MFRIVDGRIREIWFEFDPIAGLQALEMIPAQGVGPFGLLGWTFKTIGRTARLELRAKRQKAPSLGTQEPE